MENLKELSILSLSLSPNAAAQEDGVYYACVWPFLDLIVSQSRVRQQRWQESRMDGCL